MYDWSILQWQDIAKNVTKGQLAQNLKNESNIYERIHGIINIGKYCKEKNVRKNYLHWYVDHKNIYKTKWLQQGNVTYFKVGFGLYW